MSDEADGRDPDRGSNHANMAGKTDTTNPINATEKTGIIIDMNTESARREDALGVCVGSKTILTAVVDRKTVERNEDTVAKERGKHRVTTVANAVSGNIDDMKAEKEKNAPVKKKTLTRVKDATMSQRYTTTRSSSTETKIQ